MNNKIIRFLPVILAILVAGTVFCCTRKDSSEPVEIIEGDIQIGSAIMETDNSRAEDKWVYVSGAVRNPGVYLLEEGARVFEAIDMAGGMRNDAFADALNLAETVRDGQQIIVPDRSDETSQVSGFDDGLIDINKATKEELQTLPGIGEAKATAIIKYRQQQPFLSIEEITCVPGIKNNVFQQIKNLIKV